MLIELQPYTCDFSLFLLRLSAAPRLARVLKATLKTPGQQRPKRGVTPTCEIHGNPYRVADAVMARLPGPRGPNQPGTTPAIKATRVMMSRGRSQAAGFQRSAPVHAPEAPARGQTRTIRIAFLHARPSKHHQPDLNENVLSPPTDSHTPKSAAEQNTWARRITAQRHHPAFHTRPRAARKTPTAGASGKDTIAALPWVTCWNSSRSTPASIPRAITSSGHPSPAGQRLAADDKHGGVRTGDQNSAAGWPL